MRLSRSGFWSFVLSWHRGDGRRPVSLLFLALVSVSFSGQYASGAVSPQPPKLLESSDRFGIRFDADGWADLSAHLVRTGDKAKQSRIIYVSSSGNDSLAAQNRHGRGYYLPGDPEIGADPTKPSGSVQAYATFAAARAAFRYQHHVMEGTALRYVPELSEAHPDWLLFKRGEVVDLAGEVLVMGWSGGPSPAARRVFSAYGDASQPRPRFVNSGGQIVLWGERGSRNIIFSSLDLRGIGGISLMYGAQNILFEDVIANQGWKIEAGSKDIAIRRCIVSGAFNGGGHVQGLFVADALGYIWISESIFDMNGYKENPFSPATWTAGVMANVALPLGQGVQPRRTYFDRNLYLSSYQNMLLEGNIISRGGGGWAAQLRSGGIATRNVFLWNHSALAFGHPQVNRAALTDSTASQNLVLHDDHMLPTGGWGGGIYLGGGDKNKSIANDNIIAHFMGGSNGDAMLGGAGLPSHGDKPAEQLDQAIVTDNVVIAGNSTAIKFVGNSRPDGVRRIRFENNAVARSMGHVDFFQSPSSISGAVFGASASTANLYFVPDWKTFPDWQRQGFDQFSLLVPELSQLAEKRGWRSLQQLRASRGSYSGASRDIVAYMLAVDPSYQKEPEVTVDYAVPVAARRTDAPKVRQVAASPAMFGGDVRAAMTQDQSVLLAERYHAFVTFIERAKLNRKGAWNKTYTADNINNFIRYGFSKPSVNPEWAPQ